MKIPGHCNSAKAVVLAAILLGASAVVITGSSMAGAATNSSQIEQTNTNAKKKKKSYQVVKPTMNKSQHSTVPPGVWGGNDIRLVVGPSSTTLEYACAEGEITGMLTTDQDGNFDIKGYHTTRMGGPLRTDRPDNHVPARYTGRITGDQMMLKVTLTEDNAVIGEFKLERGKSVRLFKCL